MELKNPNLLKRVSFAAGLAGCGLYTVLFTAGLDHKGLPVSAHWANWALWLLTALVGLLLIWSSGKLPTSETHAHAPSRAAAAGCVAAALACFAFSTPAARYGMLGTADMVLRGISGGIFCILAFCRYTGRKPHFTFHSIICLYLAFRMISQYRIWSADPQVVQYCFYLSAYLALILAGYHFAAFDADAGSYRKLWRWGCAAGYLCFVTLAGPQERLFMPLMGIWVLTNLPRPAADEPATDEPAEDVPAAEAADA